MDYYEIRNVIESYKKLVKKSEILGPNSDEEIVSFLEELDTNNKNNITERFSFGRSRGQELPDYGSTGGFDTFIAGAIGIITSPLVAKIIALPVISGVIASFFVLVAAAAVGMGIAGFSLKAIYRDIKTVIMGKAIGNRDIRDMQSIADNIKKEIAKDPVLKNYRGTITRYQKQLEEAIKDQNSTAIYNRMSTLRDYLRDIASDEYEDEYRKKGRR